jgi:predicted GIY-YIG superfamily endonuclease
MFYIYALKDPATSAVRYVGYTSDPVKRLRAHLQDARSGVSTHKARWISSLLSRGETPELSVLEECDSNPGTVERHWIAKMLAEGCDLTNATSGGDGGPMDADARAKLSLAATGRKWSPAVRAKMSAAKKGRTHTQETKDKLRAAKIEKKFTEEHKAALRTPEAILKKREAIKKRWQDPAYKARWIAKRTGKPLSDEHKAALRNAWARKNLRGHYEYLER